jgi:hypothetical protein
MPVHTALVSARAARSARRAGSPLPSADQGKTRLAIQEVWAAGRESGYQQGFEDGWNLAMWAVARDWARELVPESVGFGSGDE